ncbi:uncharacterized protein LOC108344748 isoform X2 [Vigna angularis]|uniref:uncharacterized protein LOC108344748 isoform X2 n=1 Tax=Phaseolus angularis TaxID=3914 RepID=UPI0022B44A90|nr:uncharacterized protein LOC108344748 isoform X2 [Vigna angularis]
MALQWLILTYVVAAEAAVAILLTLPTPKLLRNRFASLVSLILQPALFIVPFAGFHLLDIYWKNEHRLMCTSEVCTAAERDRYEKSVVGSVDYPLITKCLQLHFLLPFTLPEHFRYTKLRGM